MKRHLSAFLTLLAAATAITGSLAADQTSLSGGIGYRQDSLTWKSNGRSNVNPKTKSNLHFEDVEIVMLGFNGKTTFGHSNAYFKLGFDYGWIVDGRLREQLRVDQQTRACQHLSGSYADSGKFLEAAVHNNVRRHSFVWDLDLKLGYPVQCICDTFSIAPTLGFMLNREQIRVHGHSPICDAMDDFADENNPKHGSHYRFSAWGPYVGLDFAYALENCWSLYADLEVHFGRIRRDRDCDTDYAHIDRLQRTKSFWGPSIKVGANYVLCDSWIIDASVYYSKYVSCTNRDKFTWATGNIRLDLGTVF